MQTEENTLFRFTGYHRQESPVISFGSKGIDHRRSNKPIMEKRRRARINHCLAELKTLILEAMKKDPARHSKLEKADILEMTVKHLQAVQRHQMAIAVATDPTVMTKFRSGFNDCATEVVRYVSRMDGVDPGVSQRLMGHMRNCLTSLNQLSSPFNFMSVPQLHPAWFYAAPSPASSGPSSGPFAFEPRPAQPVVDVYEKKMKSSENVSRKDDANLTTDLSFDTQMDTSSKRSNGQALDGNRETSKPSTSNRCSDSEKMWRPW